MRAFKADVRRDLGGDLSRAQEVSLALVAQTWIQVSSLDVWLAKHLSLVLVGKRTVLPVLRTVNGHNKRWIVASKCPP